MSDPFPALLLISLTLIIINLISSRRLLSRVQLDDPKAWAMLGKPNSLFSPSRGNFYAYKKLFFNGRDMFCDNTSLIGLNRQFCASAVLSQLFFAATIAAFIFWG